MKCPKCEGTIRGNTLKNSVHLECRRCKSVWKKNLSWWNRKQAHHSNGPKP